jgi:hypothetical protein
VLNEKKKEAHEFQSYANVITASRFSHRSVILLGPYINQDNLIKND